MYERVLVPTDGSSASGAAVEHAVSLAKASDATLYALYAVDVQALPAEFDAGALYDELEATGRAALEAVRRLASDQGVTVEASIASGPPVRSILDFVASHDVDVVVMGTHGRTGLDRYLLGSVTERVVRESPVPVLTVHSERASGDDDASA